MATVTSLIVYPVKSCAGINVERTVITPQGLPFDRRWMVVDAESGRFVTQRTHPAMARIRTSLPAAVLSGEAGSEGLPGAALVLSADGVPGEASVPLAIEGRPQLRHSKVWGWSGSAADEGDAAAQWLSSFLGKRVRLVRYLGTLAGPASAEAAAALQAAAVVEGEGPAGAAGAAAALERAVDPTYAPWGAEVAFADGFAVLLASTESLAELNARLDTPVPMSRFRPNIVVSGVGSAWAEDAMGAVSLGGGGGVEVALVKPCSRCTVPLVDQDTGRVGGKEPIKTMQGYRSGRALGYVAPRLGGLGATYMGVNGQPLGAGPLAVGDPVRVLRSTDWAAAA